MSDAANPTPSRGPLITLGAIAAFASFAVVVAGLQTCAGGRPADPQSAVRLKHKAEVEQAQAALLKKSGLADNADAVITRAVAQIEARKFETSKVVVPGSPTAVKQSAPAPAAPATPAATPTPAAPATPPPAAPAPPPPTPAPPAAPATPPPAPVPASPPPVPSVPGVPSN